jgi:hypothetical protein
MSSNKTLQNTQHRQQAKTGKENTMLEKYNGTER